jgi:hypothetical protein
VPICRHHHRDERAASAHPQHDSNHVIEIHSGRIGGPDSGRLGATLEIRLSLLAGDEDTSRGDRMGFGSAGLRRTITGSASHVRLDVRMSALFGTASEGRTEPAECESRRRGSGSGLTDSR